jgi:hypothetical protein
MPKPTSQLTAAQTAGALLKDACPELRKEWHPIRNVGISQRLSRAFTALLLAEADSLGWLSSARLPMLELTP